MAKDFGLIDKVIEKRPEDPTAKALKCGEAPPDSRWPEKAIAAGCVIVNQILIVPPLACFASISGDGVA